MTGRLFPLASAVAAIMALAPPAALAQERLRIATWNIGNLYADDFVALRPGAAARTPEDFAALRAYAEALDADIVALQEVNSIEAVARIFPEDEFEIVVDGRRDADIAEGRYPPAEAGRGRRETDGIYTAFAFRRGVVEVVDVIDVPELGVLHNGLPQRWGLSAYVDFGGDIIAILNVHLKSSCVSGRVLLDSPSPDCVTLARQIPEVEGWIDDHYAEGFPVIVLGDMNRRIETHGEDDDLWRPLDDGAPAGLDLFRQPIKPGRYSLGEWFDAEWDDCPTFALANGGDERGPTDYFFFDEAAWQLVDPTTYTFLRYSEADARRHGDGLSDHCPASIDLFAP